MPIPSSSLGTPYALWLIHLVTGSVPLPRSKVNFINTVLEFHNTIKYPTTPSYFCCLLTMSSNSDLLPFLVKVLSFRWTKKHYLALK